MTLNLALLLNAVLVVGLVLVLSFLPLLLGPRRRAEGAKGQPYETGVPSFAPAAGRMSVLYFRFAVLFVIFDIDLALLIPWVLNRDQLTLQAMLAMTVFLALVVFTLAYVWRKGALEI